MLTRHVDPCGGSLRTDVVIPWSEPAPLYAVTTKVLGVDPITPPMILVERTPGGMLAHRMPAAPFSDSPPPCWPEDRTGVVEHVPERHYRGAWCRKCFGGTR